MFLTIIMTAIFLIVHFHVCMKHSLEMYTFYFQEELEGDVVEM